MDKKEYLYLCKKKKEIRDLYIKCNVLNNFLNKYKSCFQDNNSIDAIKRIENYLEVLNNKYKNEYKEFEYKKSIFKKICNHEILIKWKHAFGYNCLTCNGFIDFESEKVNESKLIIEELDEFHYSHLFEDACENIIEANQDLIDGIIDVVRGIDDNKVLVHRR